MPDGCKKLDPCRRGCCWWWSEVLVVVASILASGCVTRSVCSYLVTVVLSQSQGAHLGQKSMVRGQRPTNLRGATSQSNGHELCEYLRSILASIPLTWNCSFAFLRNHYPFSSFSPWFVETKFFESLRCSWKEPCCWWILLALWTAFLGPCPWVSFWAWMKCCTSVGLPWQKWRTKDFGAAGKSWNLLQRYESTPWWKNAIRWSWDMT